MIDNWTYFKPFMAKQEADSPMVPTIQDMLRNDKDLLLLLVFNKENSTCVFEELAKSQVRTAPTFKSKVYKATGSEVQGSEVRC